MEHEAEGKNGIPTPSRRHVLGLLAGGSAFAISAAAFGKVEPAQIGQPSTSDEATIFVARDIITMDPRRPRATAVAVLGGRIVALGTLEQLQAAAGNLRYKVDRQFADKVIIAGFIEPHVHPLLAALTMESAVISIEPWDAPGGFSPAVRDEAGYRARLKAALAAHDHAQDFVTWGYHHYFHGPLDRWILDGLAPDFPVIVWHRSCHEFYLNSRAIEKYKVDADYLATFSPSQAAMADLEKGHFYEQAAVMLLERITPAVANPQRLRKGLEFTLGYYHRNGITSCCEPGGFYSRPLQGAINAVYSADEVPFNHYFIGDGKTFAAMKPDDPAGMIALAEDYQTWGKGRARYLPRQVKLFTDGAIFGQLIQMKQGYTDGHKGAWLMEPDAFRYAFQAFWDAGYHIHIHNNGDAGMDVILDNLAAAMQRKPRKDHRTTLVHFGFATREQIRRAARLGAIVSANPNYVTALAGRYKDVGIGPARTARMVPLAEAKAAGMSISFHSDMPMAPARPLQLAWSAVNRITAEGPVEGAAERIDIETALKAITIDAAYSIELEHRIGSITVGKDANFTILEADPHKVPLKDIDKIGIWGTVLEGRVQPGPGRAAAISAFSSAAAPHGAPAPVDDKPALADAHDSAACDVCGALRVRLSELIAEQLPAESMTG